MSTHHSDSSSRPARSTVGQREKAGRGVICKICEAVYVPSRTHRRLTHSPQAVVESAFMSMCHFCFRCRRPACPSCWDDVHDVCGACALDTQLPFRSSVPPLDGVVFPPIHDFPLARVRTLAPPLVCVQPGRFQRAPLPVESQTTLYLQTIPDQPVSDTSKRPLSRKRPVHGKDTSHKVAISRGKLKRVVIGIVLLIVLLVILLIVSALFAPRVNGDIAYVLHVDIRAEIAYLLQLIQHLF